MRESILSVAMLATGVLLVAAAALILVGLPAWVALAAAGFAAIIGGALL